MRHIVSEDDKLHIRYAFVVPLRRNETAILKSPQADNQTRMKRSFCGLLAMHANGLRLKLAETSVVKCL
jgi:hypothetical protein